MPCLVGRPLEHLWIAQKFHFRHVLRWNPGEFVSDKTLSMPADEKVMVPPHLFFTRRGALGSDGDLVPLDTFAPPPSSRTATGHKASGSKPARPNEQLLQAFPWLEAHMSSKPAKRAASASSSNAKEDTDPPVIVDDRTPALDNEAVEAAFKRLEQKRAEWAALPVPSMPDFERHPGRRLARGDPGQGGRQRPSKAQGQGRRRLVSVVWLAQVRDLRFLIVWREGRRDLGQGVVPPNAVLLRRAQGQEEGRTPGVHGSPGDARRAGRVRRAHGVCKERESYL